MIININNDISQWERIIFEKDNLIPCSRLYHTCDICNEGNLKGMMVIFGGRDSKETPLNDIWTLAKLGNGTWSWEKIELKNEYQINSRFNHSMVFYNEFIIILGGKGFNQKGNPLPIEVINTIINEGYNFDGIYMNRQTNFIFENNIFLFGGFDGKNQQRPLGDLYQISLEKLFEKNEILKNIFGNKNVIYNINNSKKINNNNTNNSKKMQFRLTQDVVIGAGGIEDQNMEDPSTYYKVSLNKLLEENKRIKESKEIHNINLLLLNKHQYNEALIEKFIQTLLRPFDWFDEKVQEIHSNLPFTDEEILNLIEGVIPILEKDQSLIRIRSPCKIFGNLYGLYNDLMRYFESYGNPSDDNQMGDINVMQYIFLGDFCDRGFHSLEVIFLLFALKIKYRNFIYLIRGHHEDKNINEFYGLGNECKIRLKDDINNNNSIFNLINQVFDYLPFGVLVDGLTLLVHGGIGCSIEKLDDINNIIRPISVIHDAENIEQLHIIDLLYSEYDDNESNYSINQERDKNKKGLIVKYGKKRLDDFLNNNKINLLITAHQFIKDGFCTFNDDKLLTLFSATNYMDKYNNIGAMITIAKKTANKRLNIIPKLININNDKKELYIKNKSPSPIKVKHDK